MKKKESPVIGIILLLAIIGSIYFLFFYNKNKSVIRFKKDNVSLHIGDTTALTIIVNSDNIKNDKILFSSSNSLIVVVDEEGIVTGIGEGEAIITAKINNQYEASCIVRVVDAKIPINTIVPSNPSDTPVESPSIIVTSEPEPSIAPTDNSTITPSVNPTAMPIVPSPANPTSNPTVKPTVKPTSKPTVKPTIKPTVIPTVKPTVKPTAVPTAKPTATPKPTITPVSLTEAEQICEKVKNNASIEYKSFASLKKNNDDYYVMKAAHDCANKYNKIVLAEKNATYNIYRNKKSDPPIIVQTSTDFNNSQIYIHDNIDSLNDFITGEVSDNENIFHIVPKSDSCLFNTSYSSLSNIKSIKLPQNQNGNYYVKITATGGQKVWQRVGDNKNDGRFKTDVYRIKRQNNTNTVFSTDSLFWDYSSTPVKVTVCKIDSQIYFKNANIKTIVHSTNEGEKNKFARRGILVERSNTIIENITHTYRDSNGHLVSSIKYKYQGIFKIQNAANIIVRNCKIYSLNANGQSTYDISINDVVDITIDGVTMYNDNQLLDENRWGVMGTNGCKNMVVTNSKLDRIDAHRGIYNLKVTNSTIGNHGLQIIGSGVNKNNKLEISNVTWTGTNNLVILRHDYGETWNGTITITNSVVNNASGKTVNVIKHNDYNDLTSLSFVHPIYCPSIITVSNLQIASSSVQKAQVISVKEAYYKKYFQDKYGNKMPSISADIKGVSTVNKYAG